MKDIWDTAEVRRMMLDPDAYFAKLHAKVERFKVRNKWWCLSPLEKIYCQVRNATGDDKAAFLAAFPTERHISPSAMKKRTYRLNISRKVQRYTKTLEESFAAETIGGYIALKEQMIGKVLASIEAKTANDPAGISRCRMELYMLSKILGWTPSTEVPAEDERHSPQAKTDEELKQRPMSERMMRVLRKNQRPQ